ncbi:MAG TPA: DUF58 domain-containing protein [Verrucomicrobiae bacterium]|nr:DUF58 domain-containing protein [Verrucomicrobiae bacterium]
MGRFNRFRTRISHIKQKLTPSTNQVLLVAVGLIFVYSRAEGEAVPYFLFYALAGVLALAWVWSFETARRLQYSSSLITGRSQVGHNCSLDVKVLNPFFLSIPWLELQLKFPREFKLAYGDEKLVLAMSPRETRSFTYRLVCCKRGYYQLGSANLRTGDIFGIFVRDRKVVAPRTIIVYPKIIHLDRVGIPALQSLGNTYCLRAASEDLTGPTGARRYHHGDPLNRIHWRATARTGQLQVKEYDMHTTAEVGIFLDLFAASYADCPEEILETAVTLTASVAELFHRQRVRYGLIANGKTLFVQPPSRETGQLLKTLEHLALATSGGNYGLSQTALLESRNFVVGTTLIFITSTITAELTGALRVLKQRGFGIAILQVGFKQHKDVNLTGITLIEGISEENMAKVLGGVTNAGRSGPGYPA